MTGPGRRQVLGWLATLGAAPTLASEASKSAAIEIGKYDSDIEGVVWLAYGVALANWASSSGELERAPLGPYVPSFEGEVAARTMLIKIWHELLEKNPKPFAYMDALVRVEQAGFLREYVWTVHWRSSWKQQPADLRIAEFYAWQRKELVGHEPRTGSRVRIVPAEPKTKDTPTSAATP